MENVVVVSGLPAHYESASLEQLFCGFGQISGIRDICNGTAFVTFEEKKDAEQASKECKQLNGKKLWIRQYSKFFKLKFLDCNVVETEDYFEADIGEKAMEKLMSDADLMANLNRELKESKGRMWLKLPGHIGIEFLCRAHTCKVAIARVFYSQMKEIVKENRAPTQKPRRVYSSAWAMVEIIFPDVSSACMNFFKRHNALKKMQENSFRAIISLDENINLLRMKCRRTQMDRARKDIVDLMENITEEPVDISREVQSMMKQHQGWVQRKIEETGKVCHWESNETGIIIVAQQKDQQELKDVFQRAFALRHFPLMMRDAELLKTEGQQERLKERLQELSRDEPPPTISIHEDEPPQLSLKIVDIPSKIDSTIEAVCGFLDAQGSAAARSKFTSKRNQSQSSGYVSSTSADLSVSDIELTDETQEKSETGVRAQTKPDQCEKEADETQEKFETGVTTRTKPDQREKGTAEENKKSMPKDHSNTRSRTLIQISDDEDTQEYFSCTEECDLESKVRDDCTEKDTERNTEVQKGTDPHSSSGLDLESKTKQMLLSVCQSLEFVNTSDTLNTSDITGAERQDMKSGLGEKQGKEEKKYGQSRVDNKNVEEHAKQSGMDTSNRYELEKTLSEEVMQAEEQKDNETKEDGEELEELIQENTKGTQTKAEGEADRGLEGENRENGQARQEFEDGASSTEKSAVDGGMAACSCQQSQTVTVTTIDASCGTDVRDTEDADHLDKGDEDSIRKGGNSRIQQQQLASLQTDQLIAVASHLGISDSRLEALKSRYPDEESFRSNLIDRCTQMGTTSQLCTILLLLLKTDSSQSKKTKASREDPPQPAHCSSPTSFHQQHFPPLFTGLPNSCSYPQNIWGQTPDMFSSLSATNTFTSQQVHLSGQASTTATNLHGVHIGTPPGSVPAQNQNMQQHTSASQSSSGRCWTNTSPISHKESDQTQQSMETYLDARFTQMECRMRETLAHMKLQMQKEMEVYVQMELQKAIPAVQIWTRAWLEARQVQMEERVIAALQSATSQMVEGRSSSSGDALVIGNHSEVSPSDSGSTDC